MKGGYTGGVPSRGMNQNDGIGSSRRLAVTAGKSPRSTPRSLTPRRGGYVQGETDSEEEEELLDDEEDDPAREVSSGDRAMFILENMVASNGNAKFYLLVLVFASFWLVYSGLWVASNPEGMETPAEVAMYEVIQVLAVGGYDDHFLGEKMQFRQLIYLMVMFTGLMVFAVLVGFVNDSVSSAMDNLNKGASKVAVTDHTLILGWSESTVRVVCQIAFLRRAFRMQKEKASFWKKVCGTFAASSPVAVAPIVVMCDTKTKEQMDDTIREAFMERDISPKRTCVGWDVICRVGDPTNPHDLLRVQAHRAVRILTMMIGEDDKETEASYDVIKNGASMRTLLALRAIIDTPRNTNTDAHWSAFKCIMQIQDGSAGAARALEVAEFKTPTGMDVVASIDLNPFVNTLIFNCATRPGTSMVFMELLSFDGFALRAQEATTLDLVGKSLGRCSLIFEDAIVIGVVSKLKSKLMASEPVADEGIACDPNRVITEDDRIIMISESGFPTRAAPCHAEPLQAYVKPVKQQFDTLVCGWRKEWTGDRQLASRISGMVSGLGEGSMLVFLNTLDEEVFADCMKLCEFEQVKAMAGRRRWKYQGVVIEKITGDACKLEALEAAMKGVGGAAANNFEAAVVLGTMATVNLPSSSRDLRVLQTCLLIREIHAELYPGVKLHVVGENALDATSHLFPKHAHYSRDFVNTQAIHARALTLSLAYPLMSAAVAQLFHRKATYPESPQVEVVPAEWMIPLGHVSFAELTRSIDSRYRGAICLGFIPHAKPDSPKFCPAPDEEHCYEQGDKIILIHRAPGGHL